MATRGANYQWALSLVRARASRLLPRHGQALQCGWRWHLSWLLVLHWQEPRQVKHLKQPLQLQPPPAQPRPAGLTEDAIRWTERGVTERDPLMLWFGLPYWDSIRAHPRFAEIMRGVFE